MREGVSREKQVQNETKSFVSAWCVALLLAGWIGMQPPPLSDMEAWADPRKSQSEGMSKGNVGRGRDRAIYPRWSGNGPVVRCSQIVRH